MAKRPLTQKEIAAQKKGSGKVIIENVSRRTGAGQTIPIQVKKKGGDFYRNEHTVNIGIDKSISVDADAVMMHQLQNLSMKRLITYRVVKDS